MNAISSKLLLESEVYGCSPGTPTTHRFKTITVQRIRIIRPCLQESGYASYLHYRRVDMHRTYIGLDNIEFTQGSYLLRLRSFTLQLFPSFMNCIRVKIYPSHTVYRRRIEEKQLNIRRVLFRSSIRPCAAA